MKKLSAFMVLFFYFGNISAQELSQSYFEQCNDFINFLRNDSILRETDSVYIWAPQPVKSSMFRKVPKYLLSKFEWVCYQSPCCRGGRTVADTIRLLKEDVEYLSKT